MSETTTRYQFLVDTYATERLKVLSTWSPPVKLRVVERQRSQVPATIPQRNDGTRCGMDTASATATFATMVPRE